MIKRVVETCDDQILEVVKLYDRHNQPVDEIDLADSLVIRGLDGTFTSGFISTLAVHAIQ